MSVTIVSIPFALKFSRLQWRDKAENAFLCAGGFLPVGTAKVRFLFDKVTLCKNIISSEILKRLRFQLFSRERSLLDY
jgi:hypothetical protein